MPQSMSWTRQRGSREFGASDVPEPFEVCPVADEVVSVAIAMANHGGGLTSAPAPPLAG